MFVLKDWWKYLGLLLMIYVLTAGLLVPLKPGITGVNLGALELNKPQTILVDTYNGHFDQAKDLTAYLKFGKDKFVAAKQVSVVSAAQLSVDFFLPVSLPLNEKVNTATLILNNEIDGPSILPEAVYIKKMDTSHIKMAAFESDQLQITKKGFRFMFPYRNILVETIRNTFFHVAIWMALFILLSTSLYHSIKYLTSQSYMHDIKASAFANVGIVYGLIGLATGSLWAKATWGAYWTSDVKLNLAAGSMLIYLAYWILRGSIPSVDSKARISALYNIFAFVVMIPLLLILPRMTDSLHPGNGGNPAFGSDDMENTLRMVFYPAIIGLTLLGFWIAQLTIRIGKLQEQRFLNFNSNKNRN